jgi:hypothetical protein
LVVSFAVLLILSAVMPVSLNKYSDFFNWVIFLVVLVPSLLVVGVAGHGTYDPNLLILSLGVSFSLMMGVPHLPVFQSRTRSAEGGSDTFHVLFLLTYAGLMVAVLYSYWDVMKLSGLDDIYEQRTRAADSNAGVLVGYAALWLQNAFNPFLIATGLFNRRRRWLVLLGVTGQLVCFSVFAGKIVVASTVAMFAAHVFLVGRTGIAVDRMVAGLAIAMMVVLAFLIQSEYAPTGIGLAVSSILYMRTFAIQGAMTAVYADFFTFNPYTFGSHINGANLFLPYPYDAPLGVVIGRFLVGGLGFNANSNFWATDGLAGGGLIGVLLIGLVIGVCLSLANRVLPSGKLSFAAISTIPYLMALSNVSFFTSLVTGGGLLLLMFIHFGSPSVKGTAVSGNNISMNPPNGGYRLDVPRR